MSMFVFLTQTPLPDFEALQKMMREKITPAEIRAFMRRKGAVPYVPSSPAICVASTGKLSIYL